MNRYSAPDAPPSQHPGTEKEIRATRRSKDWVRKKRNIKIYGLALILFLLFLYMVTRDRGGSENSSGIIPQVEQIVA